ncbi:MAG: MBL fold metallo-hydrolase [Woeseiaceae bacterium]|nr:MBL fold metallo-hydrolase [Woeseiaceae bacterium]
MHRYLIAALLLLPSAAQAETTEFCLEGEFDLGLRLQGLTPASGEWYATTWCVITEDESERVMFSARGNANPDMEDNWTVAYLPPDLVRIVNRDDPPDVEFAGAAAGEEARRIRRLDPSWLLAEYADDPDALNGVTIDGRDHPHLIVSTQTNLPMRGTVPSIWRWDFTDENKPSFTLEVDGADLFRGTGSWRVLDEDNAAATWERTPGDDPIQAPGDRWPSAISTRLIDITDGVYVARGVRTGFQHIIVDTEDGLVIGDAPAGWVEFHQLPPADMVPGLGVSGLSERFVDFLAEEFPDRPIRAVAITHAHDDHAGGARAFAAAGAEVYAPVEIEAFLEAALNRDTMPDDRLTPRQVDVLGIKESARFAEDVWLLSIGPGPHASAMLGVLAGDYFFVSDIHVPRDEAPRPREGREETECWFAEWAVKNLSPDVQVINSHSPIVTPVSRLAEYLESEGCRALRD